MELKKLFIVNEVISFSVAISMNNASLMLAPMPTMMWINREIATADSPTGCFGLVGPHQCSVAE